ncbi:MAG: carboxypeptidase regulatory-like domain-containing protein, partial [Bacteroidaceae bacterium]|nr:carboxypeptidase regulatory-like domain-containing protein [Bacteroidaceae bacterium]
MKFSRFFIVLAAQCLLFASLCFAQDKKENKLSTNVWGYLVDDMTGAPVVGAKVTIMSAKDSTVVDTIITEEGNQGYIKRSFVIFTITEPGEYIIKAEAEGYEPTVNRWSVEKLYKHDNFIHVTTPWYIRKPKKKRNKDIQLGEAVVKASRVKFYYKGDTIVYNADAFELAEGSMLDALIKQLPGVELKEGGEITVQGRRVDELLINGKDFLNNDRASLLENLPSYMVKNVKVFEKTNRMMEVMGDTINKMLAMDVRLKKEYSTNFVGNLDAGLGTNHTALARAFGLRIAPKSSFKIHANVNNINESHDPGEQGEWTPMQQAMSVYNIYRGGGNYLYSNDKIYYANMVHVRYTENKNDSYTVSEQFLPTGSIFGRNFNRGRTYGSAFSTNHTFYTQKDIMLGPVKLSYLRVNPWFDYSDNRGHSLNGSASANEDIYGSYGKEWRDSITTPNAGQLLRTYGLNRTSDNTKRRGY